MWWGGLSHLRAPGRTQQEHHRPHSSCTHTAGAPQISELLCTHSRSTTDLTAPARTHLEAPQTSELLGAHTWRLRRPQSSWAHTPGGSADLRAAGRTHQEAPLKHTPHMETLAMGTQRNNCSVEHTFCPSYTNACSQIWGDWSWEKSCRRPSSGSRLQHNQLASCSNSTLALGTSLALGLG